MDSRQFVRLALLVAAILAFVVAFVALYERGGTSPGAWATVAAVLAVVAAVVSAWTSQRVVELQEDSLRPNPVPEFDLRSRYQLALFRVVNTGGSPAHDVGIHWERPLLTVEGDPASIGEGGVIPVLLPRQSASVLLGLSHDFFKRYQDTTFKGEIVYSNVTGEQKRQPFVVSAEHERGALVHDDESLRTHYDLQKIPSSLDKIAKELKELRSTMERNREPE